MSPLERAVVDLVRAAGPLTGIELRDRLRGEGPLALWQACRTSPALETRTVGQRYLRLDRQGGAPRGWAGGWRDLPASPPPS